ncbi:MAG: hypothetical protein M1830_003201, partial [Pleopsidium flavum]
MSTTITPTTLAEAPTETFHSSPILACPKCGTELSHSDIEIAEKAQRRIAELETQVKILTSKATAAVDKLADYEDELRQLKCVRTTSKHHSLTSASVTALVSPTPVSAPEDITRPATATAIRTSILPVQNRLSSFLSSSGRKSSPSPQLPNHPSTPTTSDLQAAFTREQALREQTEGELSQVKGELEELSAVLFQQANEMVAKEKRAR